MTYLLAISIGPVQEFIAAARKTADLYAGSTLLARLVSAAVKTLNAGGNEFIFPANPESNGANKILLRVSDQPEQAARRAEAAAEAELLKEFKNVTKAVAGDLDMALAEKQLRHFLEFYAAWVPETGDYAADRRAVEGLLAGRKALRNFERFEQEASQPGGPALPKSPLDPAFATIFKGGKVPSELQTKLHYKASEVLDAVSVLKREYGRLNIKKVPSTSELAHWGKYPGEQPPLDEAGENQPGYSYFAILVADGDNMGAKLKELEKCGDAAAHQSFSKALDDFAEEARKTVTQCGGFPVYTGGDDVLALLPVTRALECASLLQQKFQEMSNGSTMSAGIAAVHFREPLSTSLARARHAEQMAKAVEGKSAVCVALYKRGGNPVSMQGKWPLAAQLQLWQSRALPRGLPYELGELAREWPAGFQPSVMSAEARRIAARKSDSDGQKLSPEALQEMEFSSVAELENFAQMLILARFLGGKGELE